MPPQEENIGQVLAHTSKGSIQGTTQFYNQGRDKYYSFECIPYAHVPIGNLRFAAPKVFRSFADLKPEENKTCNKEDCLFLCIYTPEVRPLACIDHYTRPVIVFVPNLRLSPRVPDFKHMYGGEFLSSEDVVLVVLHYRQDILGFGSLGEAKEETEFSGLHGLDDIATGFAFVKNEISNFGGCPDNITAYGHGTSCHYLRFLNVRPLSGNLFHKMILSSSMGHSLALDDPLQLTQYNLRQVAEAIGPDEKFDDDLAYLDYLRNVPIDVLLDHSKPMFSKRSERIVRKNNLLAVQGDIYATQMPVLIGFNSMEGLFERTLIPAEHLDPVEYLGELLWLTQTKSTRQRAAKNAAKIIEVYKNNLKTIGCSDDIYLEMIETDIKYLVGIIHLVTNIAKEMYSENVYLYQFSADFSEQSKWNQCDGKCYPGVAHAEELKFLFNSTCETGNAKALNPVDKLVIIKRMTKIWAQFARTGNPNPSEYVETWLPIGEQLTHYYEIRSRSVVYREFSKLEKIRFQLWEKIYGIDFFSTQLKAPEPERKAETDEFVKIMIPQHGNRRPVLQTYTILPKEKSHGKVTAYTSKGAIQGDVNRSYNNKFYNSFRHVPYAQVPVGNLRFAAPKDIGSFDDLKSLTLDESGRYGLEDNLFLHIYTPEVRPETSNKTYYTRPVVVFVPGRLTNEAEQYRSEDLYGPQYLMEENVVLVVLSYRRGILGFTAFQEPNAKLDVPIDAGIQDIVKGFRFVKNEIRHFGGCPDNVTAYGQGKGAAYVRRIAARYGKNNLFHKMILSSSMDHAAGIEVPIKCYSVPYLVRILAPVQVLTSVFMEDKANCIEFLRKVPIEELLKYDVSLLEQSTKYKVIRRKYMLSLEKENYETTMPVLIGYNSMEGLIEKMIPSKNNNDNNAYQFSWTSSLVDEIFNDRQHGTALTTNILNQFYATSARVNHKGENDDTEYEHTDACYIIGTIALASHFVRAMAPENVFLYRFEVALEYNFTKKLYDWNNKAISDAAHADELGYIFKTPINDFVEKDSYNELAVKRMTKLWAQFAKNGNPNPERRGQLLDVWWKPIGKNLNSCFHIGTRHVSHSKISDSEADAFRLWEDVFRLNFFTGPLRRPACW